MQKKIFAVGDSHSLRCFENHPHIADSKALFGYNKLDGRTAFNLARHDKRVRKIIPAIGDRHIIFVFGEVDVRIHIKYKHRQTGTPIDELLCNTANRYTDYVRDLRQDGYDIHIFNVVPTGNFSTPAARRWKERLIYPFTTNRLERTRYTEELNRQLERCCALRDIPFINIYQYLVDDRGRRKKELIYDFAHLNNKTADLVMAHYSFQKCSRGPGQRIPSPPLLAENEPLRHCP